MLGTFAALEGALQHEAGPQRASPTYLGFHDRVVIGAYLARTLWLQGHSALAVERAHLTVEDATPTDHPVTMCIALVSAFLVFFGTGDLHNAEAQLDRLISIAKSYSLAPYLVLVGGFRGQLAICRGHAKAGVESLQSCLAELHAARYEILSTPLKISLTQGMAAIGRVAEGMTLIDQTIGLVEANGDNCYMPELLRVKAGN